MNKSIRYILQFYMYIFFLQNNACDNQFFARIPLELVEHVFAKMKDLYSLPWQAMRQLYTLKLVCIEWKKLLSDEKIPSLLNISSMAFAAAKGDVNEIIRLKLAERCCIRMPDDAMYTPSDYAIGMKQESAINLFQIVNGVEGNDELPDEISAYTDVIIEVLKSNNVEKVIPLFLQNNSYKIDLLKKLHGSETRHLWSQSGGDFIAFMKQGLSEDIAFTCIKKKNIDCLFHALNQMCSVKGDINTYDVNGQTMLHRACALSGANFVKLLLTISNINVNKKTIYTKATPLHMAAIYNNVGVIRALLKINDNDKEAVNRYGYTPLLSAIIADSDYAMRLLRRRKANIQFLDECGNNMVHCAAYFNSIKCIKFLLDTHKDMINSRNKIGTTPLLHAAYKHNLGMVRLLISYGADLDARNSLGYTALHYASDVDVVRTLCMYGADPNISTFSTVSQKYRAYTPLHYAAQCEDLDIIKTLIAYEACPRMKTADGKTAWKIASEKGYTDIADYLSQLYS